MQIRGWAALERPGSLAGPGVPTPESVLPQIARIITETYAINLRRAGFGNHYAAHCGDEVTRVLN